MSCTGTLTVTDSDNNRVQQFALAAPAAPACGQLPPVANPPPPKLPTLPAPPGPQLSVKVVRSARLLAKRGLLVRVECDTSCTLAATGTLTPTARPPKHHRRITVSLRPVTRRLAAARGEVVRLALSPASTRRLSRALRGRRGLAVSVQLTAAGSAGAPTVVTERLRANR